MKLDRLVYTTEVFCWFLVLSPGVKSIPVLSVRFGKAKEGVETEPPSGKEASRFGKGGISLQ